MREPLRCLKTKKPSIHWASSRESLLPLGAVDILNPRACTQTVFVLRPYVRAVALRSCVMLPVLAICVVRCLFLVHALSIHYGHLVVKSAATKVCGFVDRAAFFQLHKPRIESESALRFDCELPRGPFHALSHSERSVNVLGSCGGGELRVRVELFGDFSHGARATPETEVKRPFHAQS